MAKQSETTKEEEPSSCKVLLGEGNDEVCTKHKTTGVTLAGFQNYSISVVFLYHNSQAYVRHVVICSIASSVISQLSNMVKSKTFHLCAVSV